jgi:hypothetical protein
MAAIKGLSLSTTQLLLKDMAEETDMLSRSMSKVAVSRIKGAIFYKQRKMAQMRISLTFTFNDLIEFHTRGKKLSRSSGQSDAFFEIVRETRSLDMTALSSHIRER